MGRVILFIVALLGFAVCDAATEAMKQQPSPLAQKNAAATTPETPLGELLYQNHCRSCHESNAHVREHRRARSVEDIRYWVKRWSGELKLNWSSEQEEAVVGYLRDKYYKF